MTMISDNLQSVRKRIHAACTSAGRDPDSVALLAVTKTFGADALCQAFGAGQRDFGENYIQEGVQKINALRGLPLVWHMIGPVQSNKTRLVAENFDWVHSLDRLKTAQRLSEQRPAALPPLQVCLQVNADDGPNKSGVAPQELADLAQQVAALPKLRLRGLMAIPEPAVDAGAAHAVYSRLEAMFASLKVAHSGIDTFSLGMSADLELAIQHGSTMVRVGSAIFGSRKKP